MRELQCVALLLLLAGAYAKVIDGTLQLSAQSTEQYISKFSFSAFENANIRGEFHVEKGDYFDQFRHALVLCLYDETQWAKFQEALSKGSLCQERERLASWKTARIQPKGAQGKRNFSFASKLAAPKGHAHYWFAVLMDCYLEEYDAHPPPMRFAITMTNGDSHLPADERGMITVNLLTLLALGGYGGWCVYAGYGQLQRSGQIHLISLIFAGGYALQLLSVACELLHLRQYAIDGKGLRFRHTWLALDFASGLTQTMSELTLSVLLIALGFGWTLGLDSQQPLSGVAGRLLSGLHSPGMLLRGVHSPSALLLLGIAGAQVILHAMAHGYNEDFNNFHDFESTPGLLLLLIRLLLAATFLFALRRTLFSQDQQHEETVRALSPLALGGTLWFLCLPLFTVLALALPPSSRHRLVAGGSTIVQAVALALLSALFSPGSPFYKASSLRFLGQELGGRPRPGIAGKIAVD